MAYIEREALINQFDCCGGYTVYGESTVKAIISRIKSRPTADVVEVVHCKNCKCFEKFQAGHLCNKFGGIVTKEDYCSRGERMANNGNQNP